MLKAYAIILAAGYGSRMKQCKPTLPLGDKTALQTLADAFIHAGVTPLVVTGYAREQVDQECQRLKLRTIHNANFDDGMFSSVRTGCNALPDDADVFFITPVDIPLIRTRTITMLLDCAAKTEAAVLHPILDDSSLLALPDFLYATEAKRGHPPCMRASLKQEILQFNGEGGLANALDLHADSTQYIPVIDSGMLVDMDTPTDYENLCAMQRLHSVPTIQECYAIWNTVALSTHIRKHSISVADVARVMLKKLPDISPLFEQTVIAGAMLHDIAKGMPQHAAVGAKLVTEFGFPALSPCIADHSHFIAVKGAVTASEIIFLADKFVEGTNKCTLDRRYKDKMACYADSPEVVAAIQQKLLEAQAVLDKVNSAANTDFNTLLTANGNT
jgi:CTP:molybdopterin cytidylyltransferase MocA